MRSGFVLLMICVSMGLLPAQQATGTIEGFLFDLPTKSLRPVNGSLGSATLGQPILGGLAYGSVAPHQSFALVFQDEHCALLSGLGSQTTLAPVAGAFAVPDGIAWSGDGSTAVLYSRAGNWIQTISGLPAAPNPGQQLSAASLGGSLTAVATDLHGTHVAIGIAGGTAGVYQVAGGANFVPLLSFSKPIALAFSEDGGTLFGLDAATDQLFEQSMTDLSSEAWSLGSIADPIALRPAHDATSRAVVYVAGRADRLLVTYDPTTQQVLTSAPLSFQPTGIDPLGTTSFVLDSRMASSDILWSFRNTQQPSIYFVPAAPVQSRETHRQ